MSDYTFEVTEISPVERDVKVTVAENVITERMNEVFEELAASANIKGFRKGKVPRKVIERMYKKRVIKDVQNEVMEEGARRSIEKYEIKAVAMPTMRPPEYDGKGDLSYSFVVESLPDIDKVDFEGISVERERVVVHDDKVDEELERRRESNAVMKTIEERKVSESEDWLKLDYEGFFGEEPLEGGSQKDQLIQLGSGQFVPGFEESLIGKTIGEQFEFSVTFPEDYRMTTIAGKEVTFKCKINEIAERILPELDDEFAKDLGEYEDLNQLRIAVRDELEKIEKNRVNGKFRQDLWVKLVKQNPLPLPSSIIEEETAQIMMRQREEMTRMGLDPEKLGIEPGEVLARARNEAEYNVRAVLLREKLAKDMELVISDDEMKAHVQSMADEMGVPIEQLAGYYQDPDRGDQLKNMLRHERITEMLEEKVNVVEVDPKKDEDKQDSPILTPDSDKED